MIANDGKGGIDDASAVRYEVRNIGDQQPVYIDVAKETEKPLMAKIEMYWTDDTHTRLSSNTLEFAKNNLFKLQVVLRTDDGKTYSGPISVFCEDIDTKERIRLKGFAEQVDINSSIDIPLYSVWLRSATMPVTKGKTYRMIVVGKIDGKEADLNHVSLRDYFLKMSDTEVTLTQDAPTGIDTPSTTASMPKVSFEGDNLVVHADGLQAVSLYTLNGMCVQTLQVRGEGSTIIPANTLDKGVYVVRVQCRGTATATKIHIR